MNYRPPTSLEQWLFPVDALQRTPSVTTSNYAPQMELYNRARGVEFLFRLGTSLGLPSSAMFTAATWFHRFFMRRSMEDYHRQDVAAACIFLVTKTEECGRKLRDVARVCLAKIWKKDATEISADSKEVERLQNDILLTEEALLEVLCFDFVVDNPHSELVDLFDAHNDPPLLQEYAWSIAHDSYRTPLCILFHPRIVAAACYVLAQRAVDGPHSPSLDARISPSAPSQSLPTPPSNKPASPDASRFVIEFLGFTQKELYDLADALTVLVDFYAAQDTHDKLVYLTPLASIGAPTINQNGVHRPLYWPFTQAENMSLHPPETIMSRTPTSLHGGTPSQVDPGSMMRLDAS